MIYRAFVAFSGGGAKGLVHVGALHALEARDVQFAGLAGTSAGAIVAALTAAGFRARDLIDPDSGRNVLDRLAAIDPAFRRATGIFGPGGWMKILIFRWALRRRRLLLLLGLLSWIAPPLGAIWLRDSGTTTVLYVWLAGWLLISAAGAGIVWSLLGGLTDLRRFQSVLTRLLQEQLFPDQPERVVTFGDFGVDDRPPLKVVSANLSARQLQLFSPEKTPDVPVADAVAASICLPVIFQPWRLNGDLHVDGGIVSNLPAWPFDEERELDPEALTIAVEVGEPRSSMAQLSRFTWLTAGIRTALSGSAELNLRVAGPAEQLALPTRLDLLDFDVSREAAAREVREVATAAGLRLDKRLFRLPEIYRNACQVARTLALDGLGLTPGGAGTAPRVRVAVGRLERGYCQSLRMSHSVGFEDDPDEYMLVPLEGSVAGSAWRDRESRLEVYPLAEELDLPGTANRLRRKSRLPTLAWIMCIPILDDMTGEPRLLVQLDGNSTLPEDAETAAALNGVEGAVKDFFSLVLHELKELEDDNGPQEQHL
jgi:NTE family protein